MTASKARAGMVLHLSHFIRDPHTQQVLPRGWYILDLYIGHYSLVTKARRQPGRPS